MGPGSWGEPKELRRNEGAAERLSMVSGELPLASKTASRCRAAVKDAACSAHVRDSCCSSSAKCQRRHHSASRGSLTRCKESGASTGLKGSLFLQAP